MLAAGVAAGLVAAPGCSHAEDGVEAPPVSGATVTADRQPLQREAGLSTLATTLLDTPQAVSLIPAEQLKAQGQRTALWTLDQSIQALSAKVGQAEPDMVRLAGLYNNLLRMWAEV